MPGKKVGGRDSSTNLVNIGSDYSDEEEEFLRAVDRWKTRKGKKFLLATDYLKILKDLGWRRDDGGEPAEDRTGTGT